MIWLGARFTEKKLAIQVFMHEQPERSTMLFEKHFYQTDSDAEPHSVPADCSAIVSIPVQGPDKESSTGTTI